MSRFHSRPPRRDSDIPKWREWLQGVLNSERTFRPSWTDVYPSAVSVGGGSSVPSFSAYGGSNLQAREFVGVTVAKDMTFEFQLPHTRIDDSNIVPHLHLYVPDDATGGDIKFTCEYEWCDINDTGAVSTTTVSGTVTRTASQGISKNQILSFGEIDGTGKGLSSIFSCRIRRDPADAADTFAASVWLKSADVHAQMGWMGSYNQYTRLGQ